MKIRKVGDGETWRSNNRFPKFNHRAWKLKKIGRLAMYGQRLEIAKQLIYLTVKLEIASNGGDKMEVQQSKANRH